METENSYLNYKMNNLFKILIPILLLIASCDKKDPIIENQNEHTLPVFISTLNPVDDEDASYNVSKNVIQGIASFENIWFVSQKSGNSILLFNILDEDGNSLYHKRLNISSHGQDLTFEQISENELFLYTSQGDFEDTRNTGLVKLKVSLSDKLNNERNWSLTDITVEKEYNLNYTNSTPAINEEKSKFAIRSKNTILIHKKELIIDSVFSYENRFTLNSKQLKDNKNFSMWFQGIAMKNNQVYCLTGNQQLTTEKKIFVYNESGIVEKKYIFDTNDLKQEFYEKLEPEGLTFKENKLYFTIMTKKENQEGNIKYLYKIQ